MRPFRPLRFALVLCVACAIVACDDEANLPDDAGDATADSAADAGSDPDLAGPDLRADAVEDPEVGDDATDDGDAVEDGTEDAAEDVDATDTPELPGEDASDVASDGDTTGDTAVDTAADVPVDTPVEVGKDASLDLATDTASDVADTIEEPGEGDPNEPNDTTDDATEAEPSFQQAGLSIHNATDDDWFEVTLDEETGLRVEILFAHAAGDLDMAFYNDAMARLGLSEGTVDNELLVFGNLAPGVYYIHVYGFSGAINTYGIEIDAVDPPEVETLFSDLTVSNLQNPLIIREFGGQLLGLVSYLPNIGTAPAPGSDFGDAYAAFRIIDQTTGDVVLEGVKGPIYLTNNGGCGGESYAMWVAAGAPAIPGTGGAPTTTDPGCTDVYVQETNAFTVPLMDITSVPNGSYYYELEVNHDASYDYEPDWALANNRGWVAITISGSGASRTVTQTGAIQRSGRVVIDSGTASTVLGSGAALGALGATFEATAAIGRPIGLAQDADGQLLVALYDDGSVARREGDGSWTRLAAELEEPWGLVVLEDGDILVAESGADRLTRLESDGVGGFPTRIEVPVDGLVTPTDLALGADGRLYVANSGAHAVLAVSPDTGSGAAVVGTGTPGHAADGDLAAVPLSWPGGVDVDAAGLVFVADGHNNRLRAANPRSGAASFGLVDVPAGEVVTLVGNGGTGIGSALDSNTTNGFAGERRHGRAAIVDWPSALRVVDERIFFLDADNHRLRVLDEHGAVNVLMGDAPLPASNGPRATGSAGVDVGDGGTGLQADLKRPRGLLVVPLEDGEYDIYIADTDNFRVRLLSGVGLE